MNGEQPTIVAGGAGRFARHLRLLLAIYVLNLALGLCATAPVAMRLRGVLDFSLASESLSGRFEVPAFFELASHSDVSLRAHTPAAFFFALTYLALMVFLTGGILQAYRSDTAIPMADFFQACGACFLRFVRLALLFALALVPLALLLSGLMALADRASLAAQSGIRGAWISGSAMVALALLSLALRLWFDVAQVITLGENEPRVRRALRRAFGLVWRHFFRMFRAYLGISLLAWAGLAVVLAVWVALVRPHWVGVSFVLTQGVIVLWLSARLWQRASAVAWYESLRPAEIPARVEPEPVPAEPVMAAPPAEPETELSPVVQENPASDTNTAPDEAERRAGSEPGV